jgi:hypothetical protein
MILRTIAAFAAFTTALALAWVAVWGVLFTGWMPGATPADLAWRWLVALLSLAVGASALVLLVVAVWLLIAPLTRLRDAILTPASK